MKVVNPGGIETWKQARGNVTCARRPGRVASASPRGRSSVELARAVDELGLPHPMHLHGLNLGLPGNARTTLETLQALDGHRAHLAHIQFHSYGGSADDVGSIDSQVPLLADYLNAHPGLTVDVGQVLFGDTTSMTADGPVGQFLHTVTGRKWISHDVEMETGCGVVPITYDDRNAVHALQWAIGLEWYLRVDDPWRIAMSTDHPNGGSFLAYPADHRPADGPRPPRRRARATPREGPGPVRAGRPRPRVQPVRDRHHHAGRPGPDARPDPQGAPRPGRRRRRDHLHGPTTTRSACSRAPRYLIKAGQIVLDDGDLRAAPEGRSLHVAPEYDPDVVPEIEEWFAAITRSSSPTTRSATRTWPIRRPSRAGRSGPRKAVRWTNPRGARRVNIQGVAIADTFAEAFPMTAARAIVTAETAEWAEIAAASMTGYATSVIACDAEAAVERRLGPEETPDGRPGVSVLVFAFSREALEKALANRVGQCVMTCPTTACYNGLPVGEKTIVVGGRLRYFGDGWQISKRLDGRRYWRIPVMDGEFTCEETFGTLKGVAGGNIILLGVDGPTTLAATEAAVRAMRAVPDVILPFPGGIARSGSKVGSKYKAPGQHQHRVRPDPPRPGRARCSPPRSSASTRSSSTA